MGTPANRTRAGDPGWRNANEGFSGASSCCASIDTRFDTDPMSCNSSSISRDLSLSSGDTTISTGCEIRSR